MVNIRRLGKHLLATRGPLKKAFPARVQHAIERAIKAGEATHRGQIRFVVEGALDGAPLFREQSGRERALDLFSHLRIWDTEENNGVLIYLLYADHLVEIIADRGINAHVGAAEWQAICAKMESAYRRGAFEEGTLEGIAAISAHLARHFPASGRGVNELPDAPVVIVH
ncbi:MAG TPA: TPM domain-containing protein [Xanthobacteraceae bacterium]|nr:TPM domain-containing protein [Xanthobacteraceae bacterium]